MPLNVKIKASTRQDNWKRTEPLKNQGVYSHSSDWKRTEPLKSIEVYAVTPYINEDADSRVAKINAEEMRVSVLRKDNADLKLNEVLPGEPSPSYSGIELPHYIKLNGTSLVVEDAPNDVEGYVEIDIIAEN